MRSASSSPSRASPTAGSSPTSRRVAAIRRLTPEDLSRPAPPDSKGDPVRTHDELLAVFGFHDAYHAGRTGLVRRFLGRPSPTSEAAAR